MKRVILLLFLFFSSGSYLKAGDIDIKGIPAVVTQYETIILHFEKDLGFENPFDLLTNQAVLKIRRPDYSSAELSFFYDGNNEDGIECWKARFTPKHIGKYLFQVIIKGIIETVFEVNVTANNGKSKGGLCISENFGIFEYENGDTFRGIGINVCWTDDYDYYFRKMQAAGMNVTRIWMCPWHLSFEWEETGLGRYNLHTAKRLDEILQLADKYGIYIILCMDYHGIARKGLGYFKENRWRVNPYNMVNGGPCNTGSELFTSAIAKEYYKKRYKYIISRYGFSSQIATWEFFNEADLMAGQAVPMNRWHIEMAEYIQSIDIHNRMVSTSSTRRFPEKLVDAFKSPAMDYVMFHDYNTLNLAPLITNIHEAAIEYYQKPLVLGEIGVEYRGADRTMQVDSQHVGLHNFIWAGWFNQTPVIPMSWWWDNYIDPQNLWTEYKQLSDFVSNMDFNVDHLQFQTLTAGQSTENTGQQVPCFIRAIYFGADCALWFKNMDYQWWMVNEGNVPQELGSFIQPVPDLIPGNYTVSWYNPQNGEFLDNVSLVEVKEDGILSLNVVSFAKDLACFIRHK